MAELWEYDQPIPGDPYGGRQKASLESEGDALLLSVWSEEDGGFWASVSLPREEAQKLLAALLGPLGWASVSASPPGP